MHGVLISIKIIDHNWWDSKMMHYNRSSTNILLKTKLNNAHCVRDKRYTLITRHRRTSHYKGELCIWFICIQMMFHHARKIQILHFYGGISLGTECHRFSHDVPVFMWKQIWAVFAIVSWYICCRWRSNYQLLCLSQAMT
jgi:hypothetical protein